MTVRVTKIRPMDKNSGAYLFVSPDLVAPMFLASLPLSEIGDDIDLVLPACKFIKEISRDEAQKLYFEEAAILVYNDSYFIRK